jgi:CDP-diacylglycerol--glycerol-3-phosphate 3-phosphatidyltransferase/cardiolipin synthase
MSDGGRERNMAPAMTLNFPTILTLLRIASIPVFAVAYFLPWRHAPVLCALLFAAAALTDWLDGYLARRWNQTSRFGAFLDPVADKLMVATALVLLVEAHPTPWFAVPAAVIVGREIAVSALREWMATVGDHGKVPVSWIGKWKTTVQMVAILLLLYRQPLFGFDVVRLGLALILVAAVLTLWSMFSYLWAAWPALRE